MPDALGMLLAGALVDPAVDSLPTLLLQALKANNRAMKS
jgi:hypothetical protein